MSPTLRSHGGRQRTARLQRLTRAAGSVDDELRPFETLEAADYLARLAGDEDLIRFLQLSSFDIATTEWAQFARALAEYGYGVFRAWFGTGEILRRLSARSVRGRSSLPSPFTLDEDAVGELAAELIVRGIRSFRDNVLLRGRWRGDGGATLKTYFVGHLLFMVPGTFRQWQIDGGARESLLDPEALTDLRAGPAATDRVELRVILDDICGELPTETTAMFKLQAAGCSVSEIANRLCVSESKVKTDMMRARRRVTRVYPEANQWIS